MQVAYVKFKAEDMVKSFEITRPDNQNFLFAVPQEHRDSAASLVRYFADGSSPRVLAVMGNGREETSTISVYRKRQGAIDTDPLSRLFEATFTREHATVS